MLVKPETLWFYAGETKYVQFEMISRKGEKVIVTDAVYTITHNGEMVETGTCEILNGNSVQFLIQMDEHGTFDVEVTYKVAPETRKARCKINVD